MATYTNSSNSYLEMVEKAVRKASGTVDWLIVAHDDSALVSRVEDAFADESSAVIVLPQEEWDFASGELADAVEAALDTMACQNVMLVGTAPADQGSGEAKELTGYARLLQGARRTSESCQKAQSRFAESVKAMRSLTKVRERYQSSADFKAYGLLYREECGSFFAYDPVDESYHPLGEG